MQVHANRSQRGQLGLFPLHSEATHWKRLPKDIQERAVSLLARLLREPLKIPHPPNVTKEGRHE
jgi:hypothetical protein